MKDLTQNARAVAQRLKDAWTCMDDAADTIDALVQEAEQYLSDWKSCTAMNRELLAEVERLNKVVVIKDNLVEDMCKEVERLKDAAEGSPLSEEAMDIAQSEIRHLTGKAFLIAVERDELRMEVERLKQDVPEVGFGNMEQAEPVMHQYRWLNPANNPDEEDQMKWKPVELRNQWTDTIEACINDLEAYRYQGKPVYEVRALYTHPATDHTALLRQALEALESKWTCEQTARIDAAITAIKEALK